MINSKYAPNDRSEYSAKDLNTDFKGAKFDVIANTITNCDFKVDDDFIFDGITLDVIGTTLGDKVNLQIIDIDNVFGYGENVVLKQFATDIYMLPDTLRQVDHTSSYPAKLYAGLYVRISYLSVNPSTDATLLVRYKLHKILW